MNASSRTFIERLSMELDDVRISVGSAFSDWAPREPPVTVLFADVGRQIAQRFEATGEWPTPTVFAAIEAAMGSVDEELSSAVATGLVEALVNRAASNPATWVSLVGRLGIRTRRHADAWLAS